MYICIIHIYIYIYIHICEIRAFCRPRKPCGGYAPFAEKGPGNPGRQIKLDIKH